VCVGCLFLRTPSRAPYRTPSACANKGGLPGPPPSSPRPRHGVCQFSSTLKTKVRNLGLRVQTRQPTVPANTANSAGAPPRSPAQVSTEDQSRVGGSSDGQDEQSQIILLPETGEQPSLSSGLSDAPWLNSRRPGSLCSILEHEEILLLLLLLLPSKPLKRG
jgi:hypothetical protein